MVIPFIGCTLGGFLYDLLLFTGESPINTPFMGFYRFIPSLRRKYEGGSWDDCDRKEQNEDSAV